MQPPDVTLRPMRDSDARMHQGFPPTAEINRMYGGDPARLPQATAQRSAEWLAWMRSQPYARVIEADKSAVGAVRLHNLSEDGREAWLAIGLFADRFLARGIGRRAIRLALDQGRDGMGLRAVSLKVLAYNTRAIHCYRACGFVHIQTVPAGLTLDGRPQDDWIMRITFSQ
ncbi:GNAT family protein [Gymnodinialimonas sp. 2305UL16-5]|uniref:GNAT family N-acetyltransferase n=1 Tax=Gymnodinialimonas mytili TaxID=3126503 RepID=UPI00309EA755